MHSEPNVQNLPRKKRLEFVRSFGRRRGRTLSRTRAVLLAEFLPKIRLAPDQPEQLARFLRNFPKARSLEIGFGSGEHLAYRASLHPERGFIGCEPYWNGVSSLLAQIQRQGLENIAIWPDDVRLLWHLLPERSFGDVYILHPDPWPKNATRTDG